MDFAAFISACGFEPPSRIEPGRIVRFSTNGKRGDDAGWALLFPGGDGGVVGDWRSGEQQVWQEEKVQTFTPEQKVNWQRAIETARREAEEQRRKDYDEAAKRAAEIWALAQIAPADHPYLVRKGVKAHSARQYLGDLSVGGMQCGGALLIPARRIDGSLRSVQFIAGDGEKRYLPRGEIAGSFFMLQRGACEVICIAEGFATAASVAEATGHATAVAFDAGNLMPVAKALREKYPNAKLIVCADNDVGVESGKVKNPGVTRGTEAAEAVRGFVVVPELNGDKCDWNDVAAKLGVGAVKLAIDPASTRTGTVSVDDSALMRHLIEQEGRALGSFSAFGEKIRDRLAGRIQRSGCKLPWVKTHDQVMLRPKEVSIWAGINGHGKSALLNQVGMDLMLQGQKVFVASLEMPVEATGERMVRQGSGVINPSPDYVDVFERWCEGKLFLYDHVGRETPKKMVALLRYVHEQTGAQHLVIDSMMKVVRSPDDYAGQKDFVDMLCSCAHDIGIHIHLVAHSRKGESEKDRIGKFDIKGASEIADQADNLFTVFRNKAKEEEMAKGTADYSVRKEPDTILTVEKQRHGDWEGAIALFYDPNSKTYHGEDGKKDWQVSFKQMGIDEQDHVPF